MLLETLSDIFLRTHRVVLTEVWPFFTAYYVQAVLVTLPDTRWMRLAVMGAAASVASKGLQNWRFTEETSPFASFNILIGVRFLCRLDLNMMLTFLFRQFQCGVPMLMMNIVIWGVRQEPYKRLDGPQKTIMDALFNGLDLTMSMTAYGWEHGLRLKTKPAPAPSRLSFVLGRLAAAVPWLLLADLVTLILIKYGAPIDPANATLITIFDPTLPTVQRYLKGSLLTFVSGVAIAGALHAVSCILFAICVIFGSRPEKCVGGIDEPWRSTSIADFWGRRWHQWTRFTFVNFGGKPLAALTGTGRAGVVLGTFLASGIAHDLGFMKMPGNMGSSGVSTVFFTMMGVGAVLEQLWTKATGWKVDGALGWLWTMLWTLYWGSGLVDGACRIGMLFLIGMTSIPDSQHPAKLAFDFAAKLGVVSP